VTRYTTEAARGVLLLANTSLLICTFSSNFGRLAYELLLSKRNVTFSPPTPISTQHLPEMDSGGGGVLRSIEEQIDGIVALSLDLPWFAYP